MWKLAFLTIAVLAICLLERGSVSAKGNDETIIVGGGNLAPYYYAIPGTPPIQGWLGLLLNEDDQPAGRIDEPPDSAALLAASYDIYFDDLPEQGAPHASYVPAAASHAAYLYWRAARGGMPYVAWFKLTDPAQAYLDDAIKTAATMKDVGFSDLETDWLASAVRHGRYFTGPEGTPSISSNEYIITESAQYTNAAASSVHVSGDDARPLLDAYIATLHNWNPTSAENAGGYNDVGRARGRRQFSVVVAPDREVFSFVTGPDSSVLRVYAAEGFGGFFDPSPDLTSLIRRIIPAQKQTGGSPSVTPAHQASRGAGIVAGALAAGLLLTLGIGSVWSRRAARDAPL